MKSILKVDLGGIAGGEKYISRASSSSMHVIGRIFTEPDQFTAKAAGAEDKALHLRTSISVREAERIRRDCENAVDQKVNLMS